MKIVILAAGIGSRLGDHDLPKPLTLLSDGKSILLHQLEQIEKVASLSDVIIVVGYHKEAIAKAFPQIKQIENPRFASNNTAKSLLCALKDLNEVVVWINGDVVFHKTVLENIIKSNKNIMVVNRGPVADEEVKYTTDADGSILNVSKIVSNGEGEALGINRFEANALQTLIQQLRECDEKDYFERAIEKSIDRGVKVYPQVVDANDCTEIDFPQDLIRANALIHKWKPDQLQQD